MDYTIEAHPLSEVERARAVVDLQAQLEVLIAEVEEQLPEGPDRDFVTRLLRGEDGSLVASTPSEALSELIGHALALRDLIWEKESAPRRARKRKLLEERGQF